MRQSNDSRGNRKVEIENREHDRRVRARHWAVEKRQHLANRLLDVGIDELEERGYKFVG